MSGKLDLLMKIALEWHQVVQKLLSFLLLLITVKKIKIREYCLFLIKADLHFQQSMEFHSQLTDFWLNFTFNYHSIGWSSLPTPQNSRFKLKVEFSRLLQVKTCHDQEIVKFSYFDFFHCYNKSKPKPMRGHIDFLLNFTFNCCKWTSLLTGKVWANTILCNVYIPGFRKLNWNNLEFLWRPIFLMVKSFSVIFRGWD